MHKMIPTDFVLMLPIILGHRCMCIKSRDQSRLIPPHVRREFLIPLKMAENLVGYARKSLSFIAYTCGTKRSVGQNLDIGQCYSVRHSVTVRYSLQF